MMTVSSLRCASGITVTRSGMIRISFSAKKGAGIFKQPAQFNNRPDRRGNIASLRTLPVKDERYSVESTRGSRGRDNFLDAQPGPGAKRRRPPPNRGDSD